MVCFGRLSSSAISNVEQCQTAGLKLLLVCNMRFLSVCVCQIAYTTLVVVVVLMLVLIRSKLSVGSLFWHSCRFKSEVGFGN
jgi:hypothetical protein